MTFVRSAGINPQRPFQLKRVDAVEALKQKPSDTPAPYIRPCAVCKGEVELVGGGRRCTVCGDHVFPVGFEQAPP